MSFFKKAKSKLQSRQARAAAIMFPGLALPLVTANLAVKAASSMPKKKGKGKREEGREEFDIAQPAAEIEDVDDSLESVTLGYEDEEIARTSGGPEMRAVIRQRGRARIGPTTKVSGITHDQYRAGILQRALKMSGGKRPNAKQMFMAQKSVDNDMKRAGVRVTIPGARPGRVTR